MRHGIRGKQLFYLNIFIILVLGIFKADEFCTVDKLRLSIYLSIYTCDDLSKKHEQNRWARKQKDTYPLAVGRSQETPALAFRRLQKEQTCGV